MKEIHELHAKILALQSNPPEDHPVNFSRVEIEDTEALLPDELLDELETLQGRINACLPEDVDYFAFVGGAEEPRFDLVVENIPTGLPEDAPFDPAQSLMPQLTALDWEELREQAEVQHEQLQTMIKVMDAITRAPRSTKAVQKNFKEDAREFIREKRVDAANIHMLWYVVEDDRLVVENLSTGDELKERLPRILLSGGEVVTIVAFGKPLPVERIDALLAEAHRKTGPLLKEIIAKAKEKENLPPGDGIIDVEATASDAPEPTRA